MNIDHLAAKLVQMGPQGIGSIVGLCGTGILLSSGAIFLGKVVSPLILKKLPYQKHPMLNIIAKIATIVIMTIGLLAGISSSLIAGGIIGLTLSSVSSGFGPVGTSIGLIAGASLGVALAVGLGIQYGTTIAEVSPSFLPIFP